MREGRRRVRKWERQRGIERDYRLGFFCLFKVCFKVQNGEFCFCIFFFTRILAWAKVGFGLIRPIQFDLAWIGTNRHLLDLSWRESENIKGKNDAARTRGQRRCAPHAVSVRIGCGCGGPRAAPVLSRTEIIIFIYLTYKREFENNFLYFVISTLYQKSRYQLFTSNEIDSKSIFNSTKNFPVKLFEIH